MVKIGIMRGGGYPLKVLHTVSKIFCKLEFKKPSPSSQKLCDDWVCFTGLGRVWKKVDDGTFFLITLTWVAALAY